MRALTLAMLMPLAACNISWSDDDDGAAIGASGSGTTRSYAAADFIKIDQRGPDDIDVRVGSGFSVRAEGDAKTLDKIRIARMGDSLRVGRARLGGINWNSGEGIKIYVTMPRITAANLAGSGDMTIDRVEGGAFDGAIAGSGSMMLGAVALDTLGLSIAGSGSAAARGTANALKINIAGSGDVDGGGLQARGASINIAGSGSVKAMVDGDAKVSIMGSGDVDLGPKARCKTSKMGAGEVRCGG
ncbi:DUF2807 domain-containing protein [Sphingomonas sp. NBWT7]|uniref:head GIN domain-containing protein n=1 Tax=Sphingomonas sp. NBWT7 TaxID=2596913 RepID=UPI001624DBD7|nr:head GIN domain-containing protein [Sphingomonas sp. NBWT7]QNE32070.1 DUF2807 domain-containing protein [Sphingomonas sp. NBWT7]